MRVLPTTTFTKNLVRLLHPCTSAVMNKDCKLFFKSIFFVFDWPFAGFYIHPNIFTSIRFFLVNAVFEYLDAVCTQSVIPSNYEKKVCWQFLTMIQWKTMEDNDFNRFISKFVFS
jgi:hypothetical protein